MARRRGTAVHGDGNGWVVCAQGHRHWGRHGAAGLLLRRRVEDATEVLMQHRAPWTANGDTWGLPGGARDSHESARETALREAAEEAGVAAAAVRVLDELRTTTAAGATSPWSPRPCERITIVANEESLDLRWVAEAEVELLDLHPGFARTWPLLREVRGSEPAPAWRGRAARRPLSRPAAPPCCAACHCCHADAGRTASTWLTPEPVGLERERGAGHVEPPHPGTAGAGQGDRLVPARLEVGDPGPQRQGVVLAQGLDVADLEAGLLERADHGRQRLELAVGEDVALDERASVDGSSGGPGGRAIAWLSSRPPGAQQRVQVRGVSGSRAQPDVLGHADAGDGVERAVGDVAVVLHPDLDPVARGPAARDPLAGQARPAARRERDAHRARRRTCGRRGCAKVPQPQPTSSTRMPGSQPELARDEVALGQLRRLQRRPVPVGASAK